MSRILNRLVRKEELRPLEGMKGLFVVTSPYARSGPVSEFEILMEVHPYAALSHLTALAFHGLTDQNPAEIHATVAEGPEDLPPGTTPKDWEETSLVKGRLIGAILGVSIRWHRLKRSSLLGTAEYAPHGFPIRASDPEMTLVDGLLHPEWSGGIENVLRAWRRASDLIDTDRLVEHVEACDSRLLLQRAGWLLEAIDVAHPALDRWAASAVRGGSSKLVAAEPFSSTFSARWKLSINAPTSALEP